MGNRDITSKFLALVMLQVNLIKVLKLLLDKHRLNLSKLYLHRTKKLKAQQINSFMIKKIKNKICEIVCRVLGITPCLCDHNCNCKKEQK